MPLSQIVSASIEDGAVAPVDLSSVAQYTGFKNRLINGGFGIWQRGTSGFANGAYTADRWVALNITSAAQSSDTPSSAFPFSVEFANTAASFPLVLQRIESVNAQDLAGQQVAISFWAKNITGSATLSVELYYPNTRDNYSSVTLIQGFTASATPSTSWTYYTLTSNSLPSQVTNGLEVRIFRNNASAATTRVTGVQLEKGVTATAFDYRPYGTELALCQRYYQRQTRTSGVSDGLSLVFCMCQMWVNNYQAYIPFPVTMRSAPSFNSSAASTFQFHVAGIANAALTSISGSGSSVDGARFAGGTTYGSTVGTAGQIATSNSSTAFLEFSSEL